MLWKKHLGFSRRRSLRSRRMSRRIRLRAAALELGEVSVVPTNGSDDSLPPASALRRGREGTEENKSIH